MQSTQYRHHLLGHGGGQWLHKNLLQQYQQQSNETLLPVHPLLTRYQPINCRKSSENFKENKNASCQKAVDLSRFDPYTFVTNSHYVDDLMVAQQKVEKVVHVCFVGKSHSTVLYKTCQKVLNQWKRSSLIRKRPPYLKCSHVIASFPFEIQKGCRIGGQGTCKLMNSKSNSSTTQTQNQQVWLHKGIIKPKCTHAVIGLFQHPFAFKERPERPAQLKFQHWKNDILDVIRIISKTKTNIVLRSVHTNGLKEDTSRCSPNDFRTPYNADMCNKILQQIAINESKSEGNISFINTDHIIGPVWDSAEDWSHYTGEQGAEEIKYILSEILKNV